MTVNAKSMYSLLLLIEGVVECQRYKIDGYVSANSRRGNGEGGWVSFK
jgi:hypothetical protein